MPHPITLDEFNFNVSEFRSVMGSQSFWKAPQTTREAAVKGLTFCYIWVEPAAIETAAVTYEATLQEYYRRGEYMVSNS